MPDKRIIVDGVDISKCGHYWNGTCHAYTDNTGKFLLCINSPHCYFKQLKAKEQECEKLKEEHKGCRIGIKHMSIENTEICKISEKYKQALDEIEKYLDAQQKYFDGEDYHNLLDIINKAKER